MSVVKDLFGDDPKKYMGFPNITAAPSNLFNGKENRLPVGPVAEMPETPTHLSLLSDSIMRTPALNELPDHDKEDEEPSPKTPPPDKERITFQPTLDVQRFRQYVAEEQSKQAEHPMPTCLTGSRAGQELPPVSSTDGQATIPSTGGDEDCMPFQEGRSTDKVSAHGRVLAGHDSSSQPPSFLSQESSRTVIAGGPNFMKTVSIGEPTSKEVISQHVGDQLTRSVGSGSQGSGKVKTKSSHKQASNSFSSGIRSLDDLKKMVEDLEGEVARYEYETGRQQTKLPSPSSTGSFSGYTASLIATVTKLMGYLKESEVQRKADMVMREQVLQGFEEQRALVDALTNDILHTQEQNLALQNELLEYKKNTDEHLQYLKRELFAVVRSYEYQALSNSINTLYSLNPVALKQGGTDALNSMHDEDHNLEYLPGAPVGQAHEKGEKKSVGHDKRRGVFTDTRDGPSFIPLATPADHDVPQHSTTESNSATSQQEAKVFSQAVDGRGPLKATTWISSENSLSQHHPVAPMVSSQSENELIPAYQNSGSSKVTFGIPGHSEISSNIVMYPPSQVTFTHAGRREGSSSRPIAGISSEPNVAPVNLPPQASTSSRVPTGFSMNPSHNPQKHPQRQPTIDHAMEPRPIGAQVYKAQGHPKLVRELQPEISEGMEARPEDPQGFSVQDNSQARHGLQPAIANAMEPRPGDPQGFSAQSHPQAKQGLHPAFGNAMKPGPARPPAFSGQGNSQVQGPTGQRATVSAVGLLPDGPQGSLVRPQDGSLIFSQAAPSGPAVTSTQTVSVLHHQHQPHQQGHSQPNTKAERISKPKGFAAVSRNTVCGLPANHQLRERLQNMANRQKGVTARQSDQDSGNVQDLEGQHPRPTSPHVHFQEPPVAGNGQQSVEPGQEQISPPLSPIPHRNPTVKRSTAPPDKRVVINLPNAWSDVSSTISL
ncbi:uncharacterized protein LOC111336760 isoform X2 [Stylophora pistillata]|nr:uncharacterized protein LOC111336760 isoform X2 [Stylophora pistillata]